MATKVIKYPLDPTGTSKDNLVLAEPHVVPRDNARVFATFYGPYFTNSLVVRQKGNVTPLVVGTDYKAINLYQDATLQLGLSVSAAIVITNKSLGSDFEIDYQVVGGPFSLSSDAVSDLFDSLELDNRKVNWVDVLGKPVRFPPAPHLHDADDLYGMEFVYEALENLRLAILTGDVASHEQIYDYIDRVKDLIYIDIDKVNGRIDAVATDLARLRADFDALVAGDIATMKASLAAHIADKNNPHGTTKDQVGLGNVQNYSMSTNQQAIDESNTTSYLSPSALWYALKQKIQPQIDSHVNNKNNPHGVTKGQVGLGDVPNVPMATQPEAEAAATNDRFMSPLRTMQLVNSKVMPTINNHINNRSNPHGVTKGQVGLGNVDNFRTANAGETTNPNIWDAFVTPGGLAQAISALSPKNSLDGGVPGTWIDRSTGFMIQWGSIRMPTTGRVTTSGQANFKTRFPNYCFGVMALPTTASAPDGWVGVVRINSYNQDTIGIGLDLNDTHKFRQDQNVNYIAFGY